MNLICEIEAPSGAMFSKAGKYTTQMHNIFIKKDEILYDKRKKLKVSSVPI